MLLVDKRAVLLPWLSLRTSRVPCTLLSACLLEVPSLDRCMVPADLRGVLHVICFHLCHNGRQASNALQGRSSIYMCCVRLC